MVAVNSTMLPLGTVAPPFSLPDPSGRVWTLDGIADGRAALLVMFLCNHCPYVVHLGRELGLLTQRYLARDVAVVGINSNDADGYPDDAPEKMDAFARSVGWDFPYLVDSNQSVAKAYRAACTPDFFLFDARRALAYRGQFDDSRPKNAEPVTGRDLNAAVRGVLDGAPPLEVQHPSMGCNIKWKAGNEPEWFG